MSCRLSLPWTTLYAYDILISVFLSFVSMLASINYLLGSTSYTFTTHSLVDGGTTCRIYMCFHPMINSHNFKNSAPCRYLVKKSAIMCSVLQYVIDMLLTSTQYFTKKVYIYVSIVTGTWIPTIYIHYYCTLVVFE